MFAQRRENVCMFSSQLLIRSEPVRMLSCSHSGQQRALASHQKGRRYHPSPTPAPSSRCLSCVYEGEKDARDRKMLRRGAEEGRKREDRHGNEKKKTNFSQGDQIQPCMKLGLRK